MKSLFKRKYFPRRISVRDEIVDPVGVGCISALDVVRNILPNAFGFTNMVEEQYVNRCANCETDIVTKDASDRAFQFENMARSLNKHETVEIFIFGKIRCQKSSLEGTRPRRAAQSASRFLLRHQIGRSIARRQLLRACCNPCLKQQG